MKKLTNRHWHDPGSFFDHLEKGEKFTASATVTGDVRAIAENAGHLVEEDSGGLWTHLGTVSDVAGDIAQELVRLEWPGELSDHTAEAYDQVIALFNPANAACFALLDETPGQFGSDYCRNGHWKLWRTRNNAGEKLFAKMQGKPDLRRQRATIILAGLRLLRQRLGNLPPEILDIVTDGGNIPLPSSDLIDQICTGINLGELDG